MEKNFISLSLERFEQLRTGGRKTLDQLDDAQVHWSPDPESNSIAVIVRHLHGNMRSRFTDFLTSDGEKPDRNRDSEFEEPDASRQEIIELWEQGWGYVFSAIKDLGPSDLDRIVLIRNEPHTVMEAIIRQIAHFGYHVGQIVYIGKHLQGKDWKTLSIPRGRSKDFVTTAFPKSSEPAIRN